MSKTTKKVKAVTRYHGEILGTDGAQPLTGGSLKAIQARVTKLAGSTCRFQTNDDGVTLAFNEGYMNGIGADPSVPIAWIGASTIPAAFGESDAALYQQSGGDDADVDAGNDDSMDLDSILAA